MNQTVALLNLACVAGFSGGCMCLSFTLSGLLGTAAQDGARVMQALLPRMGAVMAPLLVAGLFSSSYLAWLALRSSIEHGASWLLAAGTFAAIALVTALVHLPINAQLLAAEPLPAARAAELLQRWLAWHHLRTGLALCALIGLIWPLRYALARA
jgi:uncharacterized membrane protein